MSKPLQISYHSMNHKSPLQADRALFKMTLKNPDDLPKNFTLIKGNEKGLFQVRSSLSFKLMESIKYDLFVDKARRISQTSGSDSIHNSRHYRPWQI